MTRWRMCIVAAMGMTAMGTALLQACPATPPGAGPAVVRPSAAAAPAPRAGTCDAPSAREVSTAEQLQDALETAEPGTTVRLVDGVYPGWFTIASAGTPERPITLCGSRGAVLDGGPPDTGYTMHLSGAAHWRLVGFSVRGGQKGVMLDRSHGVVVDGLRIDRVGDEALHLRAGSSDNLVRDTTIRDTGLRRAEFGEGIYVGSARSNWCRHSGCGPDRSDRNRIEGNDISATTAESIDIKEGTSGGVVIGNRFAGDGMTGADSWVDVKGNGWTIVGNTGVDAPQDGFQVHAVAAGWGEGNVFADNAAEVGGPGYGFHVTNPGGGNRFGCSNTATSAGAGSSNVPCE